MVPPNVKHINFIKEDFSNGCYIIGKGPSLDNLRLVHISQDIPIFAINNSIDKVASVTSKHIYSLRHYNGKEKYCYYPNVSYIVPASSLRLLIKHPGYYYHESQMPSFKAKISALYAADIAASFGCKKFIMLCFDAQINGLLDYADCVGYRSDYQISSERFLDQTQHFDNYLKDYQVDWIIPAALE